jgi:hypothetical protein
VRLKITSLSGLADPVSEERPKGAKLHLTGNWRVIPKAVLHRLAVFQELDEFSHRPT